MGRFFQKSFCPHCRNGQKAHQLRRRLRPKGPYGLEHPGEGAEEYHGAAQRAQDDEAPQNPVSPPQEEEKEGGAHRQAVAPVQPAGKPGKPQAEGAQEVIQHGGGHTQQNRLAKGLQLGRGLYAHIIRRGG